MREPYAGRRHRTVAWRPEAWRPAAWRPAARRGGRKPPTFPAAEAAPGVVQAEGRAFTRAPAQTRGARGGMNVHWWREETA